jgi:hypothetical protein
MARIEYDPRVIEKFAAGFIVVVYLVGGGLLGATIAVLGAATLASRLVIVEQFGPIALLISGGLGAAIGSALGLSKAAMLRLQAQQAMCQVQIERNTRSTIGQSNSISPPAPPPPPRARSLSDAGVQRTFAR